MAKKKTSHKSKTSTKVKTIKRKPSERAFSNEREIAMDFATSVHEKFKEIVKATILFGSQSTKTAKVGSDIDIVIIIDDASINWDLELISWYREELGKLVSSKGYSRDLHINTVKLTTWWNDLMHGDAVVLNILRYGEALIDIGGFFKPLKSLLLQGRIHSTPEAVHAALQRSPLHLARSKAAEAGAIEGVYWSMVDSAQAALITIGRLPPSPEHITKMLYESFVESRLLPKEFVGWYRDIFALHKELNHGRLHEIKGAEIDLWQDRAEKFLRKMVQIIDVAIEQNKRDLMNKGKKPTE